MLVARPAAAGTLTVVWDANSDQVSGYVVYMGTQAGSLTQRFDVGNTTAYVYPNAVAGQQYCAAVAAYNDLPAFVEGPKSSVVCGYSDAPPTLTNPGNQTSNTGQAVTVQLSGSDPYGQPVSYSATGLPPGLSLTASTGFISGTGTTAGSYSVRATASDGVLSASQTFTWTMITPDATAPSVAIAGPTSASTYSTSSSTIALSGTAADNIGVKQISWVSDRGASGTASGTTSWSVGSVALQTGANVITVMARDAAGNQGTDVVTVNYSVPSSTSVVLSARPYNVKQKKYVDLTWSQNPWQAVDVYRNGVRVQEWTANDGASTDLLRRGGSYTYKVCDSGTSSCSNQVTVFF